MKRKPEKNPASVNSFEKARDYAFLLLKFRLRSVEELRGRLKQKGFSNEIALDVVSFLKEKRFIDDALFAKTWVTSRLKRPMGERRIRFELGLKGLDKQLIENSISNAKQDYDELVVVRNIARLKLERLKDIEPKKAKQRVYGFLLRRGFNPDVVRDALNQI